MTSPGSMASLPPLLQVAAFEGPLDLLLDEVRRQNVAIENIAMAPIVARFLEYVGSSSERNLNLDIEWLHLAATLIDWKSRSLLPRAANEGPPTDPIRDDLIQLLLAHRKQAAEELARRRALEDARLTRNGADGIGSPKPSAEEPDEAAFLSAWDLIQQARDLALWVEQHRDDQRRWRESLGVEQDDTTVNAMMDYLHEQLIAAGGLLDGRDLLETQPTASRRSCLFLAILEMARHQQIEVEQEEIFGPLAISASRSTVNGVSYL